MRRLIVLGVAVLGLSVLGCQTVYSPAIGGIMMNVKGPIHAGDTVGDKEGMACARSILGIFADGDASIQAAAKAGGITRIASVDHHSKNTFGLGQFCTIVRGS